MKQFAVIFAFVFLWPGAAFPSLAKMVIQYGSARASFNYNPAERPLALSGLRQAARETINGVGRNVDYFHDPINRLTKETVGAASLIYDSAAGYGDAAGFDKVGNRRSRTAGAALETAGLLSYASQSFDVNDHIGADDNGSRPDPTQDNNGNTVAYGSYTYGYDLENRLISRSGGTALTLIYDGDGKRVRKKEGASGPETWYLWDDLNPTGYAQIIEERKSPSGPPSLTDAPTAHYVYGLDLVSQKRSSGSYYYGYDGHGSVRYLTAHGVNEVSDGTVTDTYTYDAFGVQIATTSNGAATENNFRYAGEYRDSDLGLIHLRARDYHPDLGRFWTADSFEGFQADPLSLHQYFYCAADPVNRIDPSGHFSIVEFSITSAKRAGLAAVTFGTIGTGYAKAKGAMWSTALAHGARMGALAGGSILSPALGAGLLAEAPLLIGLGIYNEDITVSNIPEYATYIAAGFALQYVFKMPAFSPPGVPAATTLGVTLSAEARSLIAGTSDDILLGVVDNAGTVRLFRSGRGQIEGHPDLIKQGLIQGEAQGFSIAVKDGKVVGQFRNSKLNESLPNYNLPADTTAKILQQIGNDGVRVFGVE